MFHRICMGVMVLAVGAALGANTVRVSALPQGDVQVIEVSAKKYEFTPAEGADKKAEPGLKFDANATKPEFKLPKDQPVTIEFTASQPGTYDFKCSVFCGMGHGGMRGQIIVEP
jgi:cytochrome c oxidase subunit 2